MLGRGVARRGVPRVRVEATLMELEGHPLRKGARGVRVPVRQPLGCLVNLGVGERRNLK